MTRLNRSLFATLMAFATMIEAGGACAAQPKTEADTANLPPAVAETIAKARRDCPAGFDARNAVRTEALTGDGTPSYIVDPHRFVCPGAPHLFGGNDSSLIALFVTSPSGSVVHAGDVLALDYSIEPTAKDGLPTILFTTHNTPVPAGSLDTYRWDGHGFALIGHRSLAAPPLD